MGAVNSPPDAPMPGRAGPRYDGPGYDGPGCGGPGCGGPGYGGPGYGGPGCGGEAVTGRAFDQRRPIDQYLATSGHRAVVVVPVKAFAHAKMRLAPVLGPEQRAALARKMAEHVLAAAAPLPVVVVCDDEDVATWARHQGARPLPEPGLGLNGAVNAAVTLLGQKATNALSWPTPTFPWPMTSAIGRGARDCIGPRPERRRYQRDQPAGGVRVPFRLRSRVILTAQARGPTHGPCLAGNPRPRLGLGRGFPFRHDGSDALAGSGAPGAVRLVLLLGGPARLCGSLTGFARLGGGRDGSFLGRSLGGRGFGGDGLLGRHRLGGGLGGPQPSWRARQRRSRPPS